MVVYIVCRHFVPVIVCRHFVSVLVCRHFVSILVCRRLYSSPTSYKATTSALKRVASLEGYSLVALCYLCGSDIWVVFG